MNKEHAQRMLEHFEGQHNGERISVVRERQPLERLKNLVRSQQVAELMRTPEGTQQLIDAVDREHAAKLHKYKPQSGKVFHTKAHKRMKDEKYYTPAWVLRCLARHFELDCDVLEPAAGDGGLAAAIVAAMRAQKHPYTKVFGYDIAPDYPSIEQQNFLTASTLLAPYIVTNPPFGAGGRLAFQFCWQALRLTQSSHGKVAMLLRDDFDSAKGRRALFADCPQFDKKIVICDRIRWTNLPQDPKKGPSGSHAWFVWDWTRQPGPASLLYEWADEDPMSAALKGFKGHPGEQNV